VAGGRRLAYGDSPGLSGPPDARRRASGSSHTIEAVGKRSKPVRNLVLAPLYYLLFVPISLMILLVHDPLRRSWLPAAEDYWYYCSPSRKEVVGDGRRAMDAAR
jgi:hypothetical protein